MFHVCEHSDHHQKKKQKKNQNKISGGGEFDSDPVSSRDRTEEEFN
jgi:hypothetical protein